VVPKPLEEDFASFVREAKMKVRNDDVDDAGQDQRVVMQAL
jgi:hypothetical protein